MAGVVALLASSTPATAAPKPITGKLSDRGYEVTALAASGKATSAQAGPSFRLHPLAKRVTLQLRASDGSSAGPIVVGREREGRRAIVGVQAGARLGDVEVKPAKGYAKLATRLPDRWVDRARWARAEKGPPIGAGKFGRVRSKHAQGGAPGDGDLDGVPDGLDIDDDGDLVLDNLDGSSAERAERAAQTEGCGPDNFYCQPIASSLQSAAFFQSANVNALVLGGKTSPEIQQKIDEGLVASGGLRFSPRAKPEELGCGGEPDPEKPDGWKGGWSYCTRGGTGETFEDQGSLPFPGPAGGQFDADRDGKGTLPEPAFLRPRATSAEIKTGQWLDEVVTNDDGTETLFPASLNFVFVTTPALASYSDSAGNCAKVSGTAGSCATEFSYPMDGDDPGNATVGFPVAGGPCPPDAPAACVDGDVVLTLTFWRPQRRPIEGEKCPEPDGPPCASGDWIDIGGLTYTAGVGGPFGGACQQETLSSSDPNLTTPTLPILGTGGLADLEGAQPASPGNTFTYKLDLSQCYLAGHGTSFDPGDEVPIAFQGVSGATDQAAQTVFFKRQ